MLCTEPKAITLGNKESLAFYRAWMELTGRPNREGIPVIENYAGPGTRSSGIAEEVESRGRSLR